MAKPRIDEFLPLTPAMFHILLALSAGALHGYAIMRAVDETARGGVRVGPGTIYGALQRLEGAGLVHEVGSPPATGRGRPRRTFALTRLGREVLRAEAERLVELGDLVRSRRLVSPGTDG